jgi:hypothetical protein
VDQKLFEQRLSELAEWKRIKPSEVSGSRRSVVTHDDLSPEIVITDKHYGRHCGWCHSDQTQQVIHTISFQPATTRDCAYWLGRCDLCKKKFDPHTNEPAERVFRAKGLRSASFGKKLGRPSAPMSDEEKALRRESIRRRKELANK